MHLDPATIRHFLESRRIYFAHVSADVFPEALARLDFWHVDFVALPVGPHGWRIFSDWTDLAHYVREPMTRALPECIPFLLQGLDLHRAEASEQWAADFARMADRAPTCSRELTGGLCP